MIKQANVFSVISSLARSAFLIALPCLLTSVGNASGLDVQLKDLRGAYYHRAGEKPAKRSSCAKLTYPEIKKYGRLSHCMPQDKLVECQTKTSETLLVFEELEACNRSLNAANVKEH
jgi:hypothetical protein